MTGSANVYRVHGTESYRRGRFQLHEPSSCRKLKSCLVRETAPLALEILNPCCCTYSIHTRARKYIRVYTPTLRTDYAEMCEPTP